VRIGQRFFPAQLQIDVPLIVARHQDHMSMGQRMTVASA
jgi:hypothetical protein